MRHGRSRCCAKVGPHQRSHKAASVIRRQSIKAGEDVVQPMPMPNLRRGVDPVAHDLPRQVTEPVETSRKVGTLVVQILDYSGGAA